MVEKRLRKLIYLRIQICSSWPSYGIWREKAREMMRMCWKGLQPHPNLQELEIVGFEGKRFPLWSVKMAVREEAIGSWIGLNKLTFIRLHDCNECEEIPTLGHLPNLKSLYLQRLRNVKSIKSSFYGKGKETTIVFPALVVLALTDLYELREWGEVDLTESTGSHGEVKMFPHLENLSIENCHKLMSAPSYFSCLKRLVIKGMVSCINLGNICEVKLMSLAIVVLEELYELECLPDWLFHNNQDLKVLRYSHWLN